MSCTVQVCDDGFFVFFLLLYININVAFHAVFVFKICNMYKATFNTNLQFTSLFKLSFKQAEAVRVVAAVDWTRSVLRGRRTVSPVEAHSIPPCSEYSNESDQS